MLHDFLFAPFPQPDKQQQYEQVRASLRADADGPVTLLLGNFAVEDGGEALDAVVVRPNGITILLLVPAGGLLTMPSLTHGAWKLDAEPLRGSIAQADNPFEQFRFQKEALVAWLAPQLPPEQVNLQFISGLVVFGRPVTFGPEIEEQLSSQPGTSFQLLADAAQLPRRLRQLARPDIDLTDDDLTQWARDLSDDPVTPEAAPAAPEPASAGSPWRRLWSWLGADDIPEDPPYGGYPAAQVAASSAEKQRLEQIQEESQAELRRQLQALEAREAERERNMEQLRAQLAQAPPVTTEARELQDRLAAESREKAVLEEAIRASRAESETRNQELDAKIQQLSRLIEQLHQHPGPASSPGSAQAPGRAVGSTLPAPGFRLLRRWRQRLPRMGAVLGGATLLLLALWGISRLSADPPAPYQENGKWGFAADGEPVIPARFSFAGPFQDRRAVVAENGAYGMIDPTGKEVVPLLYDALNPFVGGYARARVGDAYTFVDEEGQEFTTYFYNALDFSEGYAAVLDHRGWHYIRGPEEEEPSKPPVIFREAYSFREGLARVKLADGYTFITKDYLTDPAEGTKPFTRYELATDFENGRAQVTQQGRRFLIDTSAEPVD
ncbi:WG repeat-containing protein [Hymenobacter sp. BT175]|uniref:WG repeat-containing protein n=1 Tax=Hymenobacter translucens TaxID=2886507 RepID=UPI001D0EBB44|nr:WG repeat-containing protein [Hymenobacter translucens]MCC2547301.1 WG repeat-containing protein [Hymenobacter translucens]